MPTKIKQLEEEIAHVKKQLKRKAQEEGLWENFGQAEVRRLEDKYIDISSYTRRSNQLRDLIQSFDNWCMTYTGGN